MKDYNCCVVVVGGGPAGLAAAISAKKNGAKCIGCPAGGNCPSKNGSKSACTCGCQTDTKK